MNALRRAGVWLGLVEDDDDGRAQEGIFDQDFGEPDETAPPRRARPLVRQGLPSAAGASRTASVAAAVAPPSTMVAAVAAPPQPARAERASVRQLARPQVPPPAPMPDRSSLATHDSPATRDNLALAPQVQLRERAVVSDDPSRRYQITTLHPTTYNEARSVGEHFRDGSPVIMNLTGMDEADAKRLVDFAAGLAFGLRGSMERVTNRVFLLSPSNIQVSAEDKARIAESGFFDQG